MPIPKKHLDELYALLMKAKTSKDMRLLLADLLTPKERATVAERLQLVQMLMSGTPQRTIAKTLKMSISKVTRGSLALKVSKGGFRKFIPKKSASKKRVAR